MFIIPPTYYYVYMALGKVSEELIKAWALFVRSLLGHRLTKAKFSLGLIANSLDKGMYQNT